MPPVLGHVVDDGTPRDDAGGSPESGDWAWTGLSRAGDDRYVYLHLKLECVGAACQRVRPKSADGDSSSVPLQSSRREQGCLLRDEEKEKEQIWKAQLEEKLVQFRGVFTASSEERTAHGSLAVSSLLEALDPSLGERSCCGLRSARRASVKQTPLEELLYSP